ncbi:hypothetical protein HRI_003844200 [Hibiscus trionum]|uniref:Uncharacterized protein n=1 Tax=Hibiscus trionum TaxID=183268 RepID=A0A9W7MLD8_HIBTR|nr:hypothetical protein HRI_003844200 [Hibiscus trionum]
MNDRSFILNWESFGAYTSVVDKKSSCHKTLGHLENFENFCAIVGVEHQHDIIYGPQQIEICDLVVLEPSSFREAASIEGWKIVIQKEMKPDFVKEMQQKNEVTLVHCNSENHLTDFVTEFLGKIRFEEDIGVDSKTAKEEC